MRDPSVLSFEGPSGTNLAPASDLAEAKQGRILGAERTTVDLSLKHSNSVQLDRLHRLGLPKRKRVLRTNSNYKRPYKGKHPWKSRQQEKQHAFPK